MRAAEFDDLFATAGSGFDRPTETHLRLYLRGQQDLEQRVRDLASRESDCCSFFTFAVSVSQTQVTLDVRVDVAHTAVLDSLARRYRDISRAR